MREPPARAARFPRSLPPGSHPAPASPLTEALPWSTRPDGWRTDRAWYDGKAEKCVYAATDRIYGLDRSYEALAYTNKQQMDPATTTKASGRASAALEAFKHHWSERIPTENYDYDYSTASFTRTDSLAPFKLTFASQEDCGASFKSFWRDGRSLSWIASVYFPDAGLDRGRIEGAMAFQDALPLVLRDYPFASMQPGARHMLRIVPSQRSARPTSVGPTKAELTFEGVESVEVPAGTFEAFRLTLRVAGSNEPARFWFTTEGQAPWLHALVRYEDGRRSYRLQSLERTAYWER